MRVVLQYSSDVEVERRPVESVLRSRWSVTSTENYAYLVTGSGMKLKFRGLLILSHSRGLLHGKGEGCCGRSFVATVQ